MHNDSYQSDAHHWAGPLGINPVVDPQKFHNLVGSCVSASWSKQGYMLHTCVTPFGVTLVARDPQTLEVLARKKISHWLPLGPKFSGGVYFHLDHEDRVLLASNDPAVQLWELTDKDGGYDWQLQQSIELKL